MKGIVFRRYGGPDVLEWSELGDPQAGAGEVLIDVEAISVGPGDCKTRAGLLREHHTVQFPKVPGRSGVGRIATTGQRVFFSTAHEERGSCVERIVRPVGTLAAVPPLLDPVDAAALAHPGLCAWLGLTQVLEVQRGESLLVLGGSGVVGMLAIQLGAHLGVRVTATGSPSRVEEMLAAGAHRSAMIEQGRLVEPYTRMPLESRYDAVFDMVGGVSHWLAMSRLKPGGRLAFLHAEPIPAASGLDGAYPQRRVLVKVDYTPAQAEHVLRLAAGGQLTPRVARVFALADCAEAHRLVEQRGVYGRVVLATANLAESVHLRSPVNHRSSGTQ